MDALRGFGDGERRDGIGNLCAPDRPCLDFGGMSPCNGNDDAEHLIVSLAVGIDSSHDIAWSSSAIGGGVRNEMSDSLCFDT